MSISPRPATFIEKEQIFTVNRNGYICIDFTPIDENKAIVTEQKKSFILTMKNVGEVLELNTKDRYDSQHDAEGSFI